MAVDIQRVLLAAVEAALEDDAKPGEEEPRLSRAGKAVVVGAALVTAGRVAAEARRRGL